MIFDMNTLSNLANMLGKLQNNNQPNAQSRNNSPWKPEKPRGGHWNEKIHTNSPFASQNGLNEQIDASSFDSSVKDNAQNTYAGANNMKSPLDSIMSLMSKKNDIEKMMPAFANIFSKQQTTKTASFENKEKSKPKDFFSPIEFAGYTTVCALNRLYFSLKN